jgi:hypothetical protein
MIFNFSYVGKSSYAGKYDALGATPKNILNSQHLSSRSLTTPYGHQSHFDPGLPISWIG